MVGDAIMRHESKSAISCVWDSQGLRVLAHRVSRRMRSFLFVSQTGVRGLSRLPESGSESEGPAVPGVADGAHRAQTGFLGDGSAQVRMPGVRPSFEVAPHLPRRMPLIRIGWKPWSA